jgi:hypothetical protein
MVGTVATREHRHMANTYPDETTAQLAAIPIRSAEYPTPAARRKSPRFEFGVESAPDAACC